MKQSREATPLRVWIAFVLIGVGIVAYIVSYLLFEAIIAFLRWPHARWAGRAPSMIRYRPEG